MCLLHLPQAFPEERQLIGKNYVALRVVALWCGLLCEASQTRCKCGKGLQSVEPTGQMFVLSILRWRILKMWAGSSKPASQLIREWGQYVSYTVSIRADHRYPGLSNALIDKFTFRGSRALFTFQSCSTHTVFILGGKQCFDIQSELSYLRVCV